MGLDITHIKLTDQENDSSMLILKEGLRSCLMDYDLENIHFTKQMVKGIWEPIFAI